MSIPHGGNRSALPAVFLEMINDPQAYKHLAPLAWTHPSKSKGGWTCQMASSCAMRGQTRLPAARSLHHQHTEPCKMLLLLTIP